MTGYYVYSISDPRRSPPERFYVGKGCGSRAYDHIELPNQSETRVAKRIQEIRQAGKEPVVHVDLDALTEFDALKIEALLIAELGTVDTGGKLLNTVIPTGFGSKKRKALVMPRGSHERAQIGLKLLLQSVFEFTEANPGGVENADAADLLGLRSDVVGRQKNFLTYSLFGLLLRQKKLMRVRKKRSKNGYRYFVKP